MNASRNLLLRSLRPMRALSLPRSSRTARPAASVAAPIAPLRRPFSWSAACRHSNPQGQQGGQGEKRQKGQEDEDDQPAEHADFVSILDNPPQLVRQGGRHGPGLIILAIIPITAFILGCWQVQRLGWKTDLITKFEDRILREPLPLPPTVDPAAISEFDFRRVLATGRFRHDQEMLVGPRIREGADGYLVITPLEREGGTTILVNRGWIDRKHVDQRTRPDGLPTGEVTVEGLLREPWKKNSFTPDNVPEQGRFYFPDVKQMAELTGAQPVWIEATMTQDYLKMVDYESRGIPYARAAEVNLRNHHAQYIFTWFGLCAATSIMLWMVVKKPASDISRRVARSKGL